MTLWMCAGCGIEQADASSPPAICPICSDEREFVAEAGQRWTNREALAWEHETVITELEPDLYAIEVRPSFAIGQRGLLLRTVAGNVLWECPGLLDDRALDTIAALGGIAAIAASHPHLTGCSVFASHLFGHGPVYWADADRAWIRRPDPVIRLWSGQMDILPGITLIQCGGHFPGSAVLHWRAGAQGQGLLLSGDTVMVNPDRATVSFMWSYPNLIPLSPLAVQRIAETIAPLHFDRLYSGFAPGVIRYGAAAAVQHSVIRYVRHTRGDFDEVRDVEG